MSSAPPEPAARPSGSGSTRALGGPWRSWPPGRRTVAGRILWGLFGSLLLILGVYLGYLTLATNRSIDRHLSDSVAAAWNRTAVQVASSRLGGVAAPPAGDEGPGVRLDGTLAAGAAQEDRHEGTLVALTTRAALAAHTPAALDGVVLGSDGRRELTEADRDALFEAVGRLRQGEQTTLRVGDQEFRLQAGDVERSGPWIGGEQVLAVGMPTEQVLPERRSGLAFFLGSIVVLVLLLTLVGRQLVRHALSPLQAVAGVAGRVTRMDLAAEEVDLSGARVPAEATAGGDEVAVVGRAMNRLLDHVDAALQQRRREEEDLRRFVAEASHELRTPLASVRGYAEMIAMTEPLSETGRRSLERVLGQADRMTELVDGMLVLARLEAAGRDRQRGGPAAPRPGEAAGTVDVCEAAVDAVMDARVAWPDHEWVLDVPTGSQAGCCSVRAPQDTVSRIVGNLVSNAGKHTPPGTTVTVTVRRDPVGEDGVPRLRLQVLDDGGGIPAEVHPVLFDRFVRGVGVNASKEHSTGLGLPIVRAAARGLGGDVTVASEPGWTRFDVVLPLASRG